MKEGLDAASWYVDLSFYNGLVVTKDDVHVTRRRNGGHVSLHVAQGDSYVWVFWK